MKIFSKIAIVATLIIFLFSATSCVVVVPKVRHDNGKHKGWYKKENKSHHHYKQKSKHRKH